MTMLLLLLSDIAFFCRTVDLRGSRMGFANEDLNVTCRVHDFLEADFENDLDV
jgi:hypothetical protein